MDIRETKIYVDGRSDEVQKELFKLGCWWLEYNSKFQKSQTAQNWDYPFLYVNEELGIDYGNSMHDFTNSIYKEIKIKELLNE